MKKFILLAIISSTFIMCKKGEVSQFKEAVKSADSAASTTAEQINSIDQAADAILDSSNIKIKELESTQERVKEKFEATSKMVDSLSDKITSSRLESKLEKKDSTNKKDEKIVVNVPAPKIIKETKVVYKDRPKKENNELNISQSRMIKTGHMEIAVDHVETVKEIVKEEIRKNYGYIKSEDLTFITNEPPYSSSENNQKVYYLKVKVPIQNFDTLINDLSENIGEIESKNVEVTGQSYINNTVCDLSITLTDKESSSQREPETFGDKSFAAISSGWNVITSIFLFILPFWPVFLMAGIGFYFYKKKNKDVTGNNSN